MIWRNTLLLLLLALLLLVPSLSFGEVVLTDQEYEIILTELTKSETALVTQAERIKQLESTLTLLQTQLRMAKTSQEISSEIINRLLAESDALRTSLKKQESVTLKDKILIALGGFLAGNVSGGAWGISIGARL